MVYSSRDAYWCDLTAWCNKGLQRCYFLPHVLSALNLSEISTRFWAIIWSVGIQFETFQCRRNLVVAVYCLPPRTSEEKAWAELSSKAMVPLQSFATFFCHCVIKYLWFTDILRLSLRAPLVPWNMKGIAIVTFPLVDPLSVRNSPGRN